VQVFFCIGRVGRNRGASGIAARGGRSYRADSSTSRRDPLKQVAHRTGSGADERMRQAFAKALGVPGKTATAVLAGRPD